MKMEGPCQSSNDEGVVNRSLQIIKYSPYKFCTKLSSSPWFHVRVFYVRVCGFQVDETAPEFLSLGHICLSPDTLLEVNGVRSSMYSDGVSSVLRRDRVDKKFDEATFVNTDSIRLCGSVKFEVYDQEHCILSGVLEMLNSNGFIGESMDNDAKRWSMSCETDITAHSGFFKGKQATISEFASPKIEVYVAGCFSGKPLILTQTLQLNFRRKHNKKCMLDSIPEYGTPRCQKDVSDGLDLKKEANNGSFKSEHEEDYSSMYLQREGYMDWEDGELSWFNAGVRVGVGIGLGICVGVGVGVGLLCRSYQATTRKFNRRLI